MPEPAATASAPRRWKWPIRFVMMLAGLAVGLAIAEVVFHIRDDGAFPHLNCYVADDQLGVRLEPGATERISFGGNPVSSIRINAEGYRGADWPAPGSGEVVVVGDSQVFGLGVEEDETFSARLAAHTHRSVIDAGVPTYGPGEYRAVIAELLAARHPSVVVLTINMVNDLFELNHPNTTRHTVWDGWAVRKENAPESVTEFPGRHWLFGRSHLMFALRKWWGGTDLAAGGVASEGTWRDLVSAGDTVTKQRDALRAKLAAPGASRLAADEEIARANKQLEHAYSISDLDSGTDSPFDGYLASFNGDANVGDIVEEGFSESARSIVATSDLIAKGEAARRHMREQVEKWAKTHDQAKLRALITSRDAAVARRTEIADQAKLAEAFEPPLLPYVRDVRALVENAGARLVVVVLPIDVQVSAAEWAKYDAQPRDMAATRTLSEELTASIARLGVTAIDAQVALRAAEPGAFLDHDIHMTAKGHAAVAAALAAALAAPPPRPPGPALHVPLPSEWTDAVVLAIAGDDTGCDARRVGDWLRVLCGRTQTRDVPTTIAVDDPDALALVTPYQVSVVVHLDQGQTVAGTIGWAKQKRTLALSLDHGVVLGPLTGPRPPVSEDSDYAPERFPMHPFASKAARALCECWSRELDGATGQINTPTCSGAYGAATDRCARDHATSCPAMIACSWREPGL